MSSSDVALPPGQLLVQSGATLAQFRVPCTDLDANLAFFVDALGFRVEAIFPADNPRSAILAGYGLRLRLVLGEQPADLPKLEIRCAIPPATGPREWQAPNGMWVRLVAADPALVVPPTRPSLAVSQDDAAAQWHKGRAGLRYRDLIPDRHGGAFIASHIRLLEGGPVPDYVHFHQVRFQAIYCRKGWVRVVYQDQGEPFIMQAGDCVLQPPEIRHRVLESSAGAEVVEITAPSEHITRADPDMVLPNAGIDLGRDYHGQRFVHHIAANATWLAWHQAGFEYRDTGIGAATDGLAGVRVVRSKANAGTLNGAQQHANEFCFYFVLSGHLQLELGEASHTLVANGSISLPPNSACRIASASHDLEFLEVTLPAVAAWRTAS